ncbi:MAG TPA: translation initiation factor IF-3 [Candidatus Yaniella excrementigallinarum]|nr:translation initiation factor IF-3 [Candidatus Yaniella excrementigallinarum]
MSEPRVNERIRVPEVRLVGPEGEQVGIVRIEDALRLAVEADLDLVEVAPKAKPPVAKLMDFGKWKYEAAVKARQSRRNQATTQLKEVRFRLKIEDHDYQTKVSQAQRFLKSGDKVKAMIQFRGREQQRPEFGVQLLERFADDVAEFGEIESKPRQDGRNMVMVVGPVRGAQTAKGKGGAHKPREGGGSRRDRRAAAAREERENQAEQATPKNSVADAMPDELKQQATKPTDGPKPGPRAS